MQIDANKAAPRETPWLFGERARLRARKGILCLMKEVNAALIGTFAKRR
jgi:hypothetical protein